MKLTLTLIAINIIVFIFSLTNFDYIISNYGFNIKNFLAGNYQIVFTSMFLHANISHLLGNMIALFFLGWTIEKNVSKWKYLLVYFFSGAVGNLSVFIPLFGYTAETIAIGASAAISGIVGLGTFVCPGKMVIFPSIFPLPFVVAGAMYFLATLSRLFIPSDIAYAAHMLGILGGALFGLIWGENRIKRLSVFILLLLLITGLPLVIGHLFF